MSKLTRRALTNGTFSPFALTINGRPVTINGRVLTIGEPFNA